jgi:hypothetical protein
MLAFQVLPVNFDTLEEKAGMAQVDVPTLSFLSIGPPFGGLFDVDAYNTGSITNPWHPPHCGHRNGDALDIRIRDLDKASRNFLSRAARSRHFHSLCTDR